VAGGVVYTEADGDDVYERVVAFWGVAFEIVTDFENQFVGSNLQFPFWNDWAVGSTIIVCDGGCHVRPCFTIEFVEIDGDTFCGATAGCIQNVGGEKTLLGHERLQMQF
jgi:hypothetical protein